jgi:allophanate hydrolase subunit 2
VLGSRATDTLSGLGPAVLETGMRLPLGPAAGDPASAQAVPDALDGRVELRCSTGPRADWFTQEALSTLTRATYEVTPDSDRVGLRLSGPPLGRATAGELSSEGIVLGAVQVPADGRPLVFLNDHPTTGGYPVIAVVDAADLFKCAQLRPGDQVRFRRSGSGPGPSR